MRRGFNIFIVVAALLAALSTSCTKNTLVDLGTTHTQLINIRLDESFLQELAAYELDDPRTVTYQFFAKSKYAVTTSFKNSGLSTDGIYVTPGTYDVLVYTSDFYTEDGLSYFSLSSVADFGVQLINRSTMTQISPLESTKTTEDGEEEDAVKSEEARYSVLAWAPDPMYYKIMEDVEITPDDEVVVSLEKGTYRYRMIFPCSDVNVFHNTSSSYISIYGMKYWLNLYTRDYPTYIDAFQDDPEYMHLSWDTTGAICGEDCFYFDFYGLGFNESSDTLIELTLTGNGGLGSVLDITAEDDNEMQLEYVQKMIDELKACPYGGESIYGGAELNAYVLLKAQSIEPTIEQWEDVSVDFVM
ncbi:MAG: DUF5119 domain-containing protein [Rikenellaceae bacterium]